ncbi:hypothetical protein NQZ68_022744 [Dissostichus eleginoides]|nr:hypothetical protein NQZ68_022744 [Dissostichus eleginoides]
MAYMVCCGPKIRRRKLNNVFLFFKGRATGDCPKYEPGRELSLTLIHIGIRSPCYDLISVITPVPSHLLLHCPCVSH